MKKGILITALCVAALASAQAREVITLNFDWEFEAPDGTKKTVNVPHDFQIEQPWVAPDANDKGDANNPAANITSKLSSRAFKEMGTGTYRKTITPDANLKGKRVLLDFEGIMLVGDVYLNGERIGGTDYGYLGFEIDVTNQLKYGEPNEIVVIADTGKPLDSRWYTGGGIYRDVQMVVTEPDLYFNRHGLQILTPQIGEDLATVQIVGDLNSGKPNDEFTANITITGPDGQVVAQKSEPVKVQTKWRNREYDLGTLTVEAPQLWDCENPNLYTANVQLVRPDGSVADELSSRFGFRTLEFSPEFGMKLNGKKVLLKGIANHHTLGALGAAAYPAAIEKRLKLLKEFGFNHIRTSHNPYSDDFLDLCDEYGFLVVDELYDKWLQQYAGGRKDWTEQWQHDLPEWVRRDRNHPSVVVWSLGNELQGFSNLPYNDWGVTAYRLQKALLDRYDTGRPVTVAMHPRYRSLETDSLPAPLVHETDIASYNYRYMYFPGDHKRFPNLIFYQSEANLSNMGPNFYIPNNDEVLGLAYWGMIDYLGESQGWPAKGFANGVFDISLEPKSDAYFLKAMFTDEPVVHIGIARPKKMIDWNGVPMGSEIVEDNWNLQPGDSAKVYTYTNCDEVRLLVNGKEIGRRANDMSPNKRSRILWQKVPYKAGNIEAVGYRNGREVARHKIETAGEAKKLVLIPDNDAWTADGIDLQHVRVYAVDSKGRRSPLATQEVTFTVDGPATLVAVGNGDITSDEANVTDKRSLYRGSALAILRADRTPGQVTLTATAPGLKPASIAFSTVAE